MKFLEGMSLRTIRFLGIALVLLTVAIGALVSVQPLILAINERAAEAASIQAEKEKIQSDFNRYSALQEYVPQMDTTTEFLSTKFPPAVDSFGFIEQIYDAAEATGIAANQIRNITQDKEVPIVDPSGGQNLNSICSSLPENIFARMVPDPEQKIKDPEGKNQLYVLCFSQNVTRFDSDAFYNAAVVNPARKCAFNLDAKEGRAFILAVGGCEEGNVVPGIKPETITIEDDTTLYPAEPIIAEIVASLKEVGFTILLDPNIQIPQLNAFIENLYRMDISVSVTRISLGSSSGGGTIVINGFTYTHDKPITAEEFIAAQAAQAAQPSDNTVEETAQTEPPTGDE